MIIIFLKKNKRQVRAERRQQYLKDAARGAAPTLPWAALPGKSGKPAK